MSTAQESIPPPSRDPRGPSSTNRRGRGGNGGASAGGGGGRRANFGGSLTTSDQASSSRGGRSNNHSRPPRPQKNSGKDKTAAPGSNDQATTPSNAVASQPQDNAVEGTEDDDDDELPPEGELCFICADPIKLTSVAPCDHRTCHICALRLRVLYKKDECTFCKTTIDRLIFTSSSTKNFADFKPSDVPYTDKKLPISFETKEALEETALLLRYNCPDPNCEVACTGWKDYKAHVRREHNRLVCQLCITNKKIFAHEHTMHTEQSLVAHEKAEHRLCEYDRRLFYSDDELFAHMRDQHEQCFICKASGSEEERWKYYRDYNMLEKHFRKQHWLCENTECLQNKFVVFANEVDFKAHQVQEHANELSARERREAQRIEANFSYDDGAEGSSRQATSRGGGGGGKGKSRANGATRPDAGASSEDRDVLGISALASRSHVPGAGPANHQSRRAMFGSGLTNPSAPQGLPTDRPRTVNDTRSVEERHQAYMDKVSSTFSGSEARITSFRHTVRAFKQGESSARDLISTFHSLVGEMDECAPLVNGLVDLVDDKDKSKALADAWNQYRIERTQFPSLTPAGGSAISGITPGTGYAGAGGRGGAALRSIKKSSAASSSQVWDNVERAASASSGHGAGRPVALREHFPSLGTTSTSAGTPSIPGSLAHAVAHGAATRAAAPGAKWSGASAAVSSRVAAPGGASVAKPFVARVHSTSGRNVNTQSSAAFPSLPTNAAKSAINAHKKTLFASKTGGGAASGKHSPVFGGAGSGSGTPAAGGSGASTPWIAGQPGRIDDFPEMASPGSATATGGLGSLDGLSEALVASQQGEAGGAGRKKKGKGVQVMTFGGVHRG
ncbi:hypothetical protein EX895_002843 [Sporisorium graminicola]|uniref:RING-type E3 ubiquitin transferase n=1 Tax=Sporisorium graminicola TaxID=280036 RepID=A0A4U7KUE2_9BASI|nr:hypothetical protein EX895_002843 [Sporisorium graminicola]TKY88133.1 hypothetical protein EX895_002843 [Sporisorium graminicola]